MPAFKLIKTRYQTRYNANWLGPVLKKLEWAQQPNVEKQAGGLYQRDTTFPKPEIIVCNSSFQTTSEAISSGPITLKLMEILF